MEVIIITMDDIKLLKENKFLIADSENSKNKIVLLWRDWKMKIIKFGSKVYKITMLKKINRFGIVYITKDGGFKFIPSFMVNRVIANVSR